MAAEIASKVRANDLVSKLDIYSDKIKVLSLDCFDTLMWRKTATPLDVFFNLQQKPIFKSLGLNAVLRADAETRARQMKILSTGSNEVNLREIYLATDNTLNDEQLRALAEEELETEMDACYAFPPVINLMRMAHQRGLKIIIVSDIYLDESQLKRLLESVLPADVMAMIDKVFCSSAYGKSKISGLFEDVMKYLNCPAESVLHIGDNFSADYVAARALKLNALHFVQQDECVTDLFRLQTASANVIDPAIRSVRPMPCPFRGVLATAHITAEKPETFIGYASLGPIMYAFAHYICDEVAQLRAAGKSPKVLFLMRDAYLPSIACEAFAGESIGQRVRISRFAAYAASFRSQDDVDDYLREVVASCRFDDMMRQLLLPEKVSGPIKKAVEKSPEPMAEFIRLIHRKDVLRIIFHKSAEYRTRLMNYLEKEVGLQSGDTLVFVDLGYSGTAQRLLTAVFEEKGIELVGRYLIALRTHGSQAKRRGLLDPTCCDDKTMHTLVYYIAMLEQLCTSTEKSVMGYEQDGSAIFSDISVSEQQHSKLASIQSECIRFIRDAKQFFQVVGKTFAYTIFRDTVVAEIGRLIFFPTEIELRYLKSFQFDLNLGTQDMLPMFNPEQGLSDLRRRGIFFMERDLKIMRTNYPAELRSAGFELALTLLVLHRYNLDINLKDMLPRQENVQVKFMRGHAVKHEVAEAVATYDGYYAVWLPVSGQDCQISILFGMKYQWLQIESAELIEMDGFVQQKESQKTINAWRCLSYEKMDLKSDGLVECLSDSSQLIMTPVVELKPTEYVFRLVFRPLVKQTLQIPDHTTGPGFTLSFAG